MLDVVFVGVDGDLDTAIYVATFRIDAGFGGDTKHGSFGKIVFRMDVVCS